MFQTIPARSRVASIFPDFEALARRKWTSARPRLCVVRTLVEWRFSVCCDSDVNTNCSLQNSGRTTIALILVASWQQQRTNVCFCRCHTNAQRDERLKDSSSHCGWHSLRCLRKSARIYHCQEGHLYNTELVKSSVTVQARRP